MNQVLRYFIFFLFGIINPSHYLFKAHLSGVVTQGGQLASLISFVTVVGPIKSSLHFARRKLTLSWVVCGDVYLRLVSRPVTVVKQRLVFKYVSLTSLDTDMIAD